MRPCSHRMVPRYHNDRNTSRPVADACWHTSRWFGRRVPVAAVPPVKGRIRLDGRRHQSRLQAPPSAWGWWRRAPGGVRPIAGCIGRRTPPHAPMLGARRDAVRSEEQTHLPITDHQIGQSEMRSARWLQRRRALPSQPRQGDYRRPRAILGVGRVLPGGYLLCHSDHTDELRRKQHHAEPRPVEPVTRC